MNTYGFTHAAIAPSNDPNDPYVLHIHARRGDRAGTPEGELVLIAKVDDERPMLATRILRMLKARGIKIEGGPLAIDMDEPDISFLTMRGSIQDDGSEWTDLEVRYVDGQKAASASFPDAYEDFAQAMYALHGLREPAYRRFAMFRHWQYEPMGGWDDFVESFDTIDEAKDNSLWNDGAANAEVHVSIVDLSTMTEVETKRIPAKLG